MGLRFLALAALFSSGLVKAAEPIPIMLLDGESAGPYHAWKQTTPVLKKELEETGLFRVDVVTAPPSPVDAAHFKPEFSKYAAVVLNYDAPDWPQPLKAAFEKYANNGGGVVVVHAADNAFAGWAEFNRMTGIGGWRNRNETAGPHWVFENGKMTAETTPGPAGSHGQRLPFLLTARMPEHPILKGLPATWMHQGDELYARMRGPGENMTVLATAYSDPANNGTGKNEPVLMTLSYGKGRIFHTTMGHDVSAMSCVGFVVTLQRGTEWAATGKVTQKAPEGFPTAATVSYRPDIAAMAPTAR
jgi:hypothetical protein